MYGIIHQNEKCKTNKQAVDILQSCNFEIITIAMPYMYRAFVNRTHGCYGFVCDLWLFQFMIILSCFDLICSTLKAILSSSKGQPPETEVTLDNNVTVVARRQVNSNVIGASFPGVSIKDLEEPVKVTFQHFKVNAYGVHTVKTCVKLLLKNRQNKSLNDNW